MGGVQLDLLDLPPFLTADMRRDLAKLEAAQPLGLTRQKGRFFQDYAKRRVSTADAAMLTASGLARVDYAGRYPRLKITAKGRKEIAE